MSKFTPGPWRVRDAARAREIWGPNMRRVCRMPRRDADARLVASAPELLDELKAAVAKLMFGASRLREYELPMLFILSKQLLADVERAKALIARIEGKRKANT